MSTLRFKKGDRVRFNDSVLGEGWWVRPGDEGTVEVVGPNTILYPYLISLTKTWDPGDVDRIVICGDRHLDLVPVSLADVLFKKKPEKVMFDHEKERAQIRAAGAKIDFFKLNEEFSRN